MQIPLSHFDWQVLRAALRAERTGRIPLGRELRVIPTRRTKDGTFLDGYVDAGLLTAAEKAGLLTAAEKADVPGPGEKAQPPQFRTRYRLTDLGRHAAEYGEYDRPHTPSVAPLVGIAAEVVASRAGAAPVVEGGAARKVGRPRAVPTRHAKRKK